MKKFWQHRVTHIFMVLLVFAVTGTAVARISGPLTEAMGIEKFTFLYWVVWFVVLFPIYQVLLITVAFVFCKYSYFKNKQKKFLRLMTYPFFRKRFKENS